MKKALMVASVASMIDQFNMPNIELLKEKGYEVHVACNFVISGTITSEKSKKLQEKLESLNVKYYQVDFDRNIFNFSRNFRAYRQLKKIMKIKFDLVHSHSPIGGVISRLTASKYRKEGLKSIYTAHGFHFYEGSSLLSWLIFYPIEKILSNITDTLITINLDDYNLALDKKFKSKSLVYIPGIGIDLEKYKPIDSIKRNEIRREYNIPTKATVLSYVAEINKNKNQTFLIDILEELIKEVPDAMLFLIGTGEKKNIDFLQNYIDLNGLENNIILFGYQENILKYLHISDIYVASSFREGLPVNVMEAMAVGLPIVATDVRGHRDLLINTKEFLVRLGDIDGFCNNILNIINSETLYNNLSTKNLQQITKFSKTLVGEKMNSIY